MGYALVMFASRAPAQALLVGETQCTVGLADFVCSLVPGAFLPPAKVAASSNCAAINRLPRPCTALLAEAPWEPLARCPRLLTAT